jgi:hypothetical protein
MFIPGIHSQPTQNKDTSLGLHRVVTTNKIASWRARHRMQPLMIPPSEMIKEKSMQIYYKPYRHRSGNFVVSCPTPPISNKCVIWCPCMKKWCVSLAHCWVAQVAVVHGRHIQSLFRNITLLTGYTLTSGFSRNITLLTGYTLTSGLVSRGNAAV